MQKSTWEFGAVGSRVCLACRRSPVQFRQLPFLENFLALSNTDM
jgi:hypothetical protein